MSIIVSSRVNDPRSAEQISMVLIVPVLLLFFGQIAGLFVLDARIILAASVALAALDGGLVYLGTRLFQREVILTRWR
jgi:ABC-2 type transport system permease protein